MTSQIYNQAKYYEIAFSFINAKKQVAIFEQCIKKYSRIKVNRVLDIACGPALQLRELARQNYDSIGLDSNPAMISYLKNVAKQENLKLTTVKADMTNFRLKEKVDFAYIMMGSIVYVKNSQNLMRHLNSVSASLKKDGLYLIEDVNLDWANLKLFKPQSWTERKEGITVKTTYQLTPKDLLNQKALQTIKLEVNDHGNKKTFIDQDLVQLFFAQEWKLLVEKNNNFEFIGIFERYQLKPLKTLSSDNFILLRKKN